MMLCVAGRYINWNIIAGEQLGIIYHIFKCAYPSTKTFLGSHPGEILAHVYKAICLRYALLYCHNKRKKDQLNVHQQREVKPIHSYYRTRNSSFCFKEYMYVKKNEDICRNIVKKKSRL